MVNFYKVENEVWYAEYCIIEEGKYRGFIYKCCKKHEWEVFIPDVFTPVKGNNEFKTLRKAKKAVIKYFKQEERV